MADEINGSPVVGEITIPITQKLVDYVVGTFLDGVGYGYWLTDADVKRDDDDLPVGEPEPGAWGELYKSDLVSRGGTLLFYVDDEAYPDPIEVTLATVQKGIGLAMASLYAPNIAAFLIENADFYNADVIIQLGCFEDVVYG